MRAAVPLIVLWVCLSVFNYGALLADQYGSVAEIYQPYADQHCRRYASQAVFYAVLPVIGTTIAVLATGFMRHGFKWRCP